MNDCLMSPSPSAIRHANEIQIGYHLKNKTDESERETTDESEKTHHCAHLARSPARNPAGQTRTASRSPLPEKLRAAVQADTKTRGLKEDLKQKILVGSQRIRK